ncbi:MAG: dephospho-CoA kinase [Azonexus sp.]
MNAIATAQARCQPVVVGLTGGIGSGKSTARECFERLGVPCIDADLVARGMHQDSGHPVVGQIARLFPGLITADGKLARGSLHQVFARDSSANRQLKSTLKPFVMQHLEQWTARQSAPYVVWESALLLAEQVAVDRVLLVDCPEPLRRRRIGIRNPDWSVEQIGRVLAMQMSQPAFLEQAQDVIGNAASVAELQQHVAAMHRHYMELWG